jgi:hypothetical protein
LTCNLVVLRNRRIREGGEGFTIAVTAVHAVISRYSKAFQRRLGVNYSIPRVHSEMTFSLNQPYK